MRNSKFTPLLLLNPFHLSDQSEFYYIIFLNMSSANCPFFIFPKKDDPDLICRKDRYVLIDIPLDPNDPSLQKITHEYNKLFSNEVEDVLDFFSTFEDIFKTLASLPGPQRFRLILEMMGHDSRLNIVSTYGIHQSQQVIEYCIK
jgi:hypothetical protein